MQELSFWIAFIGGFVSFFSPCIIPLIPAYLSYLSGVNLKTVRKQRFNPEIFLHTVFFCIGFTVVFTLLGTVLGGLGNAFPRLIVTKIGGALIILFGLYTVGLLKIGFLSQERKLDTKTLPKARYLTSLLIGFAFGIGWTPCVSAILAAILVLAANEGSIVMGSYLLFAFSIGLMIPFLATGLFTGLAARYITKYHKVFSYVNVFAGILLIILGIMIYTQTFTNLAGWFV